MDWNCTATEERLSDFLDGALLPEEAAAFSAHSAGCARCSLIVAQVRGLVSQMQLEPLVEEPPRLARNIIQATLGSRPAEQGWQRWLAWLSAIWQPRVSMGLATVAASFLIVFHAAGPRMSKLTASDLNPPNIIRAVNRQAHLGYAHGEKFVNDLRVVYEIQALLSTQPAAAPAQPPAEEQHPASPDPKEKTQTIPRPRHSSSYGKSMLAYLPKNEMSGNLSKNHSRSPL